MMRFQMSSLAPFGTAPSALTLSRRQAIKSLALACGLGLASSSLQALAALGLPRDMSRSSKTLLSAAELALVRTIGELIIPTTDTPGAIAAGVHDFINHFASSCATPAEQQQLQRSLARAASAAQSRHQQPFLALSQAQQLALLTHMELAQQEFNAADRSDFKYLKGLVLFGYYTAEVGATQELRYDAVPGGYKGEVKFSKLGKAWSLIPLP
jgi:hypothetical protein